MERAYDACDNADLAEFAFAERGVSAILENVDLSSVPSGAADTTTWSPSS